MPHAVLALASRSSVVRSSSRPIRDELGAGVDGRGLQRGGDRGVVDGVVEAAGAQQQAVAGDERELLVVRLEVGEAEALGDDAGRELAQLLVGEAVLAGEVVERVVAGERGELAVAQQVDAHVAGVDEVEAGADHEGQVIAQAATIGAAGLAWPGTMPCSEKSRMICWVRSMTARSWSSLRPRVSIGAPT